VSIKILLLEDDDLFAETIVDVLEDEGYEVIHTPNGQDALEKTYTQKFDIYLLDINVPLVSGIDFLHVLREADDTTPSIFLTSHKDKVMLKKGFESGCDDYLVKPFDIDELLLRVEALLRRVGKRSVLTFETLSLDDAHKSIMCEGSVLELSNKEYELVKLLMQHANKAVPKELIIDSLWNISEGGSEGAVRVYINRVKPLLKGVKIENIRGIGYKLAK
jgi:DNA-binding response OmpR family regulator